MCMQFRAVNIDQASKVEMSNSDSSALSRCKHPFLYSLPPTNHIVHIENNNFVCVQQVKKNPNS